MLDLSSSFEDALSNVTRALPSHGTAGADASVLAWQLFDRFGDHLCPQVLLGGWWRITASYQSTKFQSRIDVSNIASEAIEQSHSQAQQSSVSAGGGGGGTGFSVDVHASSSWGASSGDHSKKSSSMGLRHVNQTALEDSQARKFPVNSGCDMVSSLCLHVAIDIGKTWVLKPITLVDSIRFYPCLL